MKYVIILIVLLPSFFVGCTQTDSQNNNQPVKNKLTCLLFGYDSVIYYTGNSSQMQDVRKGKINNLPFMNTMFQALKDNDLPFTLKLGGGADIISNYQEMISQLDSHHITNLKIDTSDSNEENAFGFSTPSQIKSAILGKPFEPIKLNLPKDEATISDSVLNFPKASQLVILTSKDNDIYAYIGRDIRKGHKYTYKELTDLIKDKRSDKNFCILIKPSKNSSYQNLIHILDAMTITNMKRYALLDITNEEEEYLRTVY